MNSIRWAVPGITLIAAFAMTPACGSDGPSGEITCPEDNTDNNNETTAGEGGDSTGSSMGSSMTETADFTPQEVAAKLHGCRKLRYETLGSLLTDRGVDTTFPVGGANCQVDANGPFCGVDERCYCPQSPCQEVGNEAGNQGVCIATPESAGFLYSTATDSLSVPKPDSRRGEKDGHTTASAMRLFDIFIQAAPQIIANIENPAMAPACVLNGQSFPMFDPVDGSCVEESISCLIGYPATDDHILLCNLILDKADPLDAADVERKQHIAVASMLAAAHSCE